MGCQRDGAFCEYIVMPVERLYHGRGLSPQILATIEPYCIGYHGVSVASVRPGENVLIVGGGTIGTMAAIAAKAAGANVYLCDLPEAKEKIRNSCRALDLNGIVLNEGSEAMAESVRKITGTTLQRGKVIGRGFDVCIEAVGHPQTFQTCIDCAAFGGRIVLIGVSKQKLDFNFNDIQKKELKIFGSRNAMKLDFLHAIDAAVSGQLPIDQVITNIYSFGDVARAFEEYKRERGKMIKVLLDFT